MSGNTPTCVGKTALMNSIAALYEKHPHVRGEDSQSGSPVCTLSGNTPTCVGKTFFMKPASALSGKHPHVRGEDYQSGV